MLNKTNQQNFYEPFLGMAKTSLGKKYTPQTEAVYKAIANFLIQTLIDGYNGEGSKQQASNSHWYVSIITNSCQYNQNPWISLLSNTNPGVTKLFSLGLGQNLRFRFGSKRNTKVPFNITTTTHHHHT